MRKFSSTLLGLACVALVSASAMADSPALKRVATKVALKDVGKPVNMKPVAYYNHATGELRWVNGDTQNVGNVDRVATQVYNNRTKSFGFTALNVSLTPQIWEVDANGLGRDPNEIGFWIYPMGIDPGTPIDGPNAPCANPGGDPNVAQFNCIFDQVHDDYLADFAAFQFDGNDPSTFYRPMGSLIVTTVALTHTGVPSRVNCLFTEVCDGNLTQTAATNGASPCFIFGGATLANLLIDANAYIDPNGPAPTAGVFGYVGFDWWNTAIIESVPGSGTYDTGAVEQANGMAFGAGRRCFVAPFGIDPNLCPDLGDPNFYAEPNQFTSLGFADGSFWAQTSSALLGEMLDAPTLFSDQVIGLGAFWTFSFFSVTDPNIALANNIPFEFTVDVAAVVGCPLAGCNCDVDGDCDVDLSDLSGLLSGFGSSEGDALYPPTANCAVNEDGDPNTPEIIGLADLAGLLSEFGNDCDPNTP
ncbi:MAG: hypothetical protein KDA32_02345 [Phycisphaerales bacterium]|nr:hypothetical protein [Phycisphaerales bacterium]